MVQGIGGLDTEWCETLNRGDVVHDPKASVT